MQQGTASRTARSVAARRLGYDRIETPYGDAAADEALSRDVADGLAPDRDRMHEYLRARTAFFDRVVVTAVDRGITQVVIGGAGYDGRALRYARPGVRWFEVDHPATQADKRDRIARLGLATPQVSFVPADFTTDPVAEPLLAAGLDQGRSALFLFEGVAVYLDRPVLARVLAEFREVTPVASLLAISVSVDRAGTRARAAFERRVAALGEPARTRLTVDEATALLSAAGWKTRETTERQWSAGLLLAHATTHSHPERPQPTAPPPAPRSAWPTATAPPAQPAARQPPASLPLSALLSQALVAFTIEADNETEIRLPHRTSTYGLAPGSPPGAPWLTSLLMYANCLRHLPDQGITIAELGERTRTGTNQEWMRRWGYVTFTPDPGRGKRPGPDALIRPTAWGIEARDIWQSVTAEVESRWRARLGAEAFDGLRAALADVVGFLDPPGLWAGLAPYPDNWRARLPAPAVLPHYPMTLHRGGYPDGH